MLLYFPPPPQVSCLSDGAPEELAGHGVAVYKYSLVMKTPSPQVELAGVVSYEMPLGEPQAAQFSHRLYLTDFIRYTTVYKLAIQYWYTFCLGASVSVNILAVLIGTDTLCLYTLSVCLVW